MLVAPFLRVYEGGILTDSVSLTLQSLYYFTIDFLVGVWTTVLSSVGGVWTIVLSSVGGVWTTVLSSVGGVWTIVLLEGATTIFLRLHIQIHNKSFKKLTGPQK